MTRTTSRQGDFRRGLAIGGVALLGLSLLGSVSLAAPGDLDPSFGTGGIASVASESPGSDPDATSPDSETGPSRPDEPAMRPKKNATARDSRRARNAPTA